ncbi:MAG: TlpA disulfide reductase family protein [Anaerolineales bacterium]|nr:TlpA disulfide reductase family protein [Anaerolineales bacterium]
MNQREQEMTGVQERSTSGSGFRLFGLRLGPLLAIAAVLLLLVILGLGLQRAQKGPVGVGSAAPSFTLTTFEGQEISSAELRGSVVVVNFWASWCLPCEQEAAELEQAWRNYRDQGVMFLGVNYVDTSPEAHRYLQKFDISYPNGPDVRTRISQAFRIRGVPETYVIGRNGEIVSVQKGPYTSLAEIEAAVELALRQ